MDPYNNNGNRPAISHPYPPSYRTTSPSRSGPQTGHDSASYGNSYSSQQGSTNPFIHPANSQSPYDPPIQSQQPRIQDQGQAQGGRPIRGRTYSDIPLDSAPGAMSLETGSENGKKSKYGEEAYPQGWTKEDIEAEEEFLRSGMFDWNEMRRWRFWIRKDWWLYYLIIIVISVLVILMVLYHDQIVTWLRPVANWMKSVPAGWVIPIAILFVISFPPLFGHEIVAVLCGVVWGLWVGFGIVAAGTFLGEVGNFYAFKYCLRSHAEKLEKKNINYATMAHVVREGGFLIIFVVRLSAIPSHFTTVVFATCGMSIWIFMLAALLTLPKQLITVYLGVIFEQSGTGTKSTKDRIISDTVLVVGFLITIASAWYIHNQMNKARIHVWRKQRMHLASRGISLNAVNNRMTFPLKSDIEAGEDEVSSPMLPTDGLSYREAYHMPSDARGERSYDESELDIGQRQNYNNYNESPSPRPALGPSSGQIDFSSPPLQQQQFLTTSFPQAHPAANPATNNVHRTPTSMTAFSNDGFISPQQTSFPVPSPAHQGLSNYGDQAGYGYGYESGYGQR